MSRVIQTVGIKGLRVIRSEQKTQYIEISAQWGERRRPPCPACQHRKPWLHGACTRTLRHLQILGRYTLLEVTHPRFRCPKCRKTFNPPLPGISPGKQSSEPFRKHIAQLHHEGICASTMADIAHIGPATVERIYHDFNRRKASERISLKCPQILGIDEHTLHKKKGRFVTTFCDLKNHKVFDIVEGKSTEALEGFLSRLQGRERVRVICIDLSSPYRSLIRKWFPNAKIVADRFHVIRLVIYHFMNLARLISPEIKYQRGILNLLRKTPLHLSQEEAEKLRCYLEARPALKALYDEMQALRALLNLKHQSARQCRDLSRRLLEFIERLSKSAFESMETLARTLRSWLEPIARMWRFTKNNGITEGFHRKMKLIQRRAYGFRNFENYRIRVIAHCG